MGNILLTPSDSLPENKRSEGFYPRKEQYSSHRELSLSNATEKFQESKQSYSRSTSSSSVSTEASDHSVQSNLPHTVGDCGACPNGDVFLSDFKILKLIGKGSHGSVYLVNRRGCPSEELYAMKEVKKGNITFKGQQRQLRLELDINIGLAKSLKVAKCPYIAPLLWAFHTKTRLYMVFSYCSGGELYYHIGKRGRIPEHLARFYAAELLLALKYLHERGIVYRDLKPENIVLTGSGHVNLVDFGLCKLAKEDTFSGPGKQLCGTTEYLAPEVILGKPVGYTVDWWSFGMVLYEMLSGLPPWYSYNRTEVVRRIVHRPVQFPPYFSESARSLISKLLNKSPCERLGFNGAEEIMKHPFFASVDWLSFEKGDVKAPFVPPAHDQACNFDREFTEAKLDLEVAPVIPGPGDEFAGFHFNSSTYDNDARCMPFMQIPETSPMSSMMQSAPSIRA